LRSREQIDVILRGEVESALQEFRAANQRFAEVLREVGRSLLPPDGTLAASQALARKQAASGRLERALKRHNRWILEGVVPEDLTE
jgi:hypothetical protein